MKKLIMPALFGLAALLLFWQVMLAQTTTTVMRDANLRAGPGTTFAVVGGLKAGSAITIVGSNEAGDWYQLDGGQWIAAFLVKDAIEGVAPAALSATVTATVSITQSGQAAQVTKIIDGDTIDVSINGQTYRVRYILVNTPETGQPFYAEATEANRRMVIGKTVYLVKDVSETDRYQRLLRYVYLADGTFVNLEIVRQGYAQVATFPPDVTKEKEIRAAQQEALTAKRGLWTTVITTTPSGQAATAQPTAIATATASPNVPAVAATAIPATATPLPATANCDPAYPTLCIPPNSPDLNCGDVGVKGFTVLPPDPHRFDRDKDGIGCES